MISLGHVLAQTALLTVGPQGIHTSIGDALQAAQPWDTIQVAAGIYSEHPVIAQPVVLLAEPGAVIDGNGSGVVLTVLASATVRGFTIRGSGDNQSQEDAGILAVGAAELRIEGNKLDDVLFGIYLKQCHGADIRENEILGKDVAFPLRGDGIRLWYSHRGRVIANRLYRVRDLVVWFSDSTVVHDNRVIDSRYGLHYMYSDHNRFERNAFISNRVGAFIMYSDDITFRENVFANARGTAGRGLGFKDADRIHAEGNILVKNAVGISVDNSPSRANVTNVFRNNVIAYNDVAVAMLPSVRGNEFRANWFRDNVQPVTVTGGGTALANTWEQNTWSEYAGFDRDGDGFGDTPFTHERLFDNLWAKHEPLRLFSLSLAATSIDLLSRVFPLLAPQPVVVDASPRTGWPEETVSIVRPRGSPAAALPFLLIAAAALASIPRLRRVQRAR